MGARGLNKVMLIGNLTRDPDIKYLGDGRPVCNFSVATNESYKGKDGKLVEKTEFHNVSAFGPLAEICGQHLKKGQQVYVEGKLETRKYKDKDDVEKSATSVSLSEMFMMGRAGPGDSHAAPQQRTSNSQSRAPASVPAGRGSGAGVPADDFDDSIPFG